MPIYEYKCSSCQKAMEVMQKVNDPAPAQCPECKAEGTLARLVSRTSFQLKGGGWYSDLYGSTKKSDASSSTPAASSSESSSSGASSGGTGSATSTASSSTSTSAAPASSSSSSSSSGGNNT